MFVYPHKLILKTCGTTTLLAAIPRLLEIVSQYCNCRKIWRVFYSRKSFMFPERQLHPHKDWKDEVAYLDQHFAAYTVGKVNDDHCHNNRNNHKYHDDDQTIEILMTELSPATIRKFYRKPVDEDSGGKGGTRIDRETGLINLYPSALLDSYLFEPCGYSSNGLLKDNYFNIHVTPEVDCSYASFETNIFENHEKIPNLINQVINIFEPRKFTVTVFNTNTPNTDKKLLISSISNFWGYVRKDKILYEFDGYDLIFGHFEREKNVKI
ncbi:9980_t:CDS:2 [Diversispora eburnea]|uniref:9980_t:CDS:1 n=1 Tax=Diversispora eburnea TaxID=1213867 RepID=A0A9N8Z8V4_9GLOM|nr:9980_t:CDS:2 [Diversispora eburnea]